MNTATITTISQSNGAYVISVSISDGSNQAFELPDSSSAADISAYVSQWLSSQTDQLPAEVQALVGTTIS